MENVRSEKKKETNKWLCALAYLIFFAPLLADSENQTYKFHANQSLILLILYIAVNVIGAIIPVIGWLIILPLGGLFCLILFIMGIVNSINENEKELPLIGKYRLIK
ncbi:hypothetical protein EZV73_04465 [Acidaminobacter sp. JC074]|uniref:hypothetical protein n=1 Tax=Acidaminobacter sp. JC074 TaxID=2530199 RepID=UPI001F117275|nr:hypothetical protein [Acidaminobacter sp. JC074]MCH4886807.1 hypothetical protein [Acidaminobacter sp. JC074]